MEFNWCEEQVNKAFAPYAKFIYVLNHYVLLYLTFLKDTEEENVILDQTNRQFFERSLLLIRKKLETSTKYSSSESLLL